MIMPATIYRGSARLEVHTPKGSPDIEVVFLLSFWAPSCSSWRLGWAASSLCPLNPLLNLAQVCCAREVSAHSVLSQTFASHSPPSAALTRHLTSSKETHGHFSKLDVSFLGNGQDTLDLRRENKITGQGDTIAGTGGLTVQRAVRCGLSNELTLDS